MKPGDIDRRGGRIMTTVGWKIPYGDIWVSRMQAVAARAYGWKAIGRRGNFVLVRRMKGPPFIELDRHWPTSRYAGAR